MRSQTAMMAKQRRTTMTLAALVATLTELDRQRTEVIEQLRIALDAALSTTVAPEVKGGSVMPSAARPRPRLTKQGRAKIAAAQKRRWARVKAGKK